MKIEIISGDCANHLKENVNNFIEYYKKKIKVKDIKFHYNESWSCGCTWWGRGICNQHHNFMAMIIYELRGGK